MSSVPYEIERKYLIRRPSEAVLRALPGVQATEITQTYLTMGDDGFGRRVRRRGSEAAGWEHTYTRKKKVAFGKRIELEDVISEAQYRALLAEADPALQTVRKVRWSAPLGERVLEVDVYAFSETLATAEVELGDIDEPVTLPETLEVIRDVTDDPRFTNLALSRTLAFPPLDTKE